MPQVVPFVSNLLDDPLLGDGTPSFAGGMYSNDQPHLIQETESAYLINCDRTRAGKIVTRKGTFYDEGAIPGTGPIIQGMALFWTATVGPYLVVVSGGKLYAESPTGGWVHIAQGGVFSGDPITIYKAGAINHAGGYPVGTTSINVSGFTGGVAVGDTMALSTDLGTIYTINAFTLDGTGNVITIVINGGLVIAAGNGLPMTITRLGATVNGNFPAGATLINITGLTGMVGNFDHAVITGENIVHVISGQSTTGGNTTQIVFSPPIQSGYVSSSTTAKITFALGNDKLFWTDGIGDIWSWDGIHTQDLANINTHQFPTNTPAPTACASIVWFQNRLIALGPAAEPDAVWFSNFLDATFWDPNFQKTRVGQGESDPIVAAVPWMDLNLVIFKEHAIYVMNMDPSQNPTPTDPTQLVASYAIKLVNHFLGIASPFSIAEVGGPNGDIYFLATDMQVRSLRRVLAAETQQELGLGISFPVQDFFNRINLNVIQNAVGYYFHNRYFISIPIDSETYPTNTFVFDTIFNNWSGTWVGWYPTCFTTWLGGAGINVLMIGGSDGTVLQWIENTPGFSDSTAGTYQDYGSGPSGTSPVAIPTMIIGRGYTLGSLYNVKTGLNTEVEFPGSLATGVTATAILDGGTGVVLDTFNSVTKPLIQEDLQALGQFRMVQIRIDSSGNKLGCRTIRATGFLDSVQLQLVGNTPLPS